MLDRLGKPSRAKMMSRIMLFVKIAWLGVLAMTFLWLVVVEAGRMDVNHREASAAGLVGGCICFWTCETLAYGAAMVLLWVIRENLRA